VAGELRRIEPRSSEALFDDCRDAAVDERARA
jgi:hypothetical protein